MRGAVIVTVFATVLCACSALPVLNQNSLRPEIAKVAASESCVNNATHCTCVEGKTYRPLVEIEGTSPKMCRLNDEVEGNKCGCPGTALCEKEVFSCSKLQATGEFNELGQVACTEIIDGTCEKASKPEQCSQNVNVFVNGDKAGCVRNVPVESNVDDAYGYGDWKAQNVENVQFDRVNLRLIETTANSEIHLCVIYGNWKLGEASYSTDSDTREVKSKITADFPLNFEIQDDPNDQYGGDGTTEISTFHRYIATKSDGYCIGPLVGDGSGFRAEFYDMDFMAGLNVQTYNEVTSGIENLASWSFNDHIPAVALRPDGRANGDESVVVDFKPTCSC
mmetsp:Transcript_12604/g.27486  ORF Transcript_12604/g.27486 Transcript_12604/m.27486 type:complete len:336 (+) Transcript_12604:124-1131(+)|eukprot:CAMPEP_0185844468 /NCGR_PEP_ID=MMETSP1354-20130828/617_1 /TAXON_ID=708628 /ORGANISM="Erythrolobus madagascarensis, Strain CCMP3276" /LENGTH=335 /DNA_ID=CAMNT_0028544135 /DNA_START=115 /DNA_END=1122 /DNA_ORIENTATION=+